MYATSDDDGIITTIKEVAEELYSKSLAVVTTWPNPEQHHWIGVNNGCLFISTPILFKKTSPCSDNYTQFGINGCKHNGNKAQMLLSLK